MNNQRRLIFQLKTYISIFYNLSNPCPENYFGEWKNTSQRISIQIFESLSNAKLDPEIKARIEYARSYFIRLK